MLKVIKRTFPLEKEGELNRTKAELGEFQSMTAKSNISKGECFILHDVCYRATNAILIGEEVIPGRNCNKISINEIGGN